LFSLACAEGNPAPSGEAGDKAGEGGAEPSPANSIGGKPDWKERRIAKLTAQLRETEAREAALRQSSAGGLTEAEVETRAQARAAQLAEQRIFNDQCERVMEEGKKSFPDFESQVQSLLRVVDQKDPAAMAAYISLVKGAIKTGAPEAIIHQLGGDLNEAQRLLDMSPVDQAFALSAIAQKTTGRQTPAGTTAGAPAGVSGAPKPVVPLGGAGRGMDMIDPTDPSKADRLSSREWFARREEQIRQRRA